jgi:hypothetical protein
MPPRRAQSLPENAVIVGYAMSRLDAQFLQAFGFATWKEACRMFGLMLDVQPASLKNLRDEFDPLHNNARVGWWRRELRGDRRVVHQELSRFDDDALIAVVSDLTRGQMKCTAKRLAQDRQAKWALAAATRLRTGREAETFFIDRLTDILGVANHCLLDMRDAMAGFDFRINSPDPPWFIEVKGLRRRTGKILFTDMEWRVARRTGPHYAVVIVHSLDDTPGWELVKNPTSYFQAVTRIRETTTVGWEASFNGSRPQ